MELHSNAGHWRLEQVGVQRVKLSSFIGPRLLRHAHLKQAAADQQPSLLCRGLARVSQLHLGARTSVEGTLQALSVCNRSAGNVDNPANDEQSPNTKHCKERIPVVPASTQACLQKQGETVARASAAITKYSEVPNSLRDVLVLSHLPAAFSLKPDSQTAQVS